MKKIFPLLICVILLSGVSFAADIKVYLDNSQINLSGKAVMENGRVLVPMRSIFEAIGASVNWDANNNLITSVKGNTKIALQISNKNMGLNGKLIALEVAPKIESGRTLVPVRVISESFGYKVNWDSVNKIVHINSVGSNQQPIYNPIVREETVMLDGFSWVSPGLPESYMWSNYIDKEITINSNRISFMQCTDEVDFRNKVFTGYGWSRNLPQGTKVTLIRIGKMYPDTLYVRLADGSQGVLYQSSY